LTKVVSLVPGGPAELAGELQPGDRITNIAEGLECEFIDVVGWRIDEVVDLIRGPKGTHVRLEVIPKDADELSEERRIIEIVRDEVKLEDNAAKSEMIEIELDGSQHKIGVIDIPSFYLDINALQDGDREYRSTTRDVKNLITELQSEGMEGLILDLRQNGGGSLLESATLTDLFIEPGPVVQIRDQNNKIYRQNRARTGAFYNGPLVVLIDRLSASASEIFAGAIQDYDRGLVVGSQSFGKGTVQTVLPLPKGQIKITESKFYRISGESTQHRGVTPNIEFPSLFDPEDIGESAYDNALDWDQITGIPHKSYVPIDLALPFLIERHRERLGLNPDLVYLQNQIAIDKERRSEEYISLNETQRLSEREYWETRELAIENEWRLSRGLPAKEQPEDSSDSIDLAEASTDENTEQKNAVAGAAIANGGEDEEESEEDELPDALLDETARILIDFINIESLASRALVNN
jgi:carboxyl-terminal processing protease